MDIGGFEIIDELGRGGFARVYRAREPGGREVALKVLTVTERADAYSRFAREQRLLESLGEAEGFVPLLASGVGETGPFFAMPLLAGGTLRDRLLRAPLSFEETLQLGRRLAVSIGWAHHRGIVHRDLKPENILFTSDGRPLIADLGIAKNVAEAVGHHESITKKGAFLGTPTYMPPEQMDCSKSVDPRADVYALGAVLYECVAGRPPFEGVTIQEILVRVTKGDRERLEVACKGAPLDLTHPIEIALSLNSELRYADGFAFAQALGARLPQKARLNTTVPERPEVPPRSPGVLIGIAAVVHLVVIAVLLILRSGRAPATASTFAVAPVPSKTTAARGWFDEPLPPRLQRALDRPVYVLRAQGLELELVYVPAGDFLMGAIHGAQNEKPLHTHNVPNGFYIGRTEVTWGDYKRFCATSGHTLPRPPAWLPTDKHPVVNVSWRDASAFCEWIEVSLPTEAEWEKAAKGTGEPRQWPWGDEWAMGIANVLDSASPESGAPGDKETRPDPWPWTAPVGDSPRNVSPYGALDMAGNVAEWSADWFDPVIYVAYSDGKTEPPGPGVAKTVRGGSWKHSRYWTTVSFRNALEVDAVSDDVGFRVVLRSRR